MSQQQELIEKYLTTTCPHCGHSFTLPHRPIEVQILEQIKELSRHSGVAEAKTIAANIYLSLSQTQRHLLKLEVQGKIYRIGQRKGWRIAKPNEN